MRRSLSMFVLVLFVALGSPKAMSATTGGFQWPFDKTNQTWPLGVPIGCYSTGYYEPSTINHGQYYLQYNGGYHMGEDWNGVCGGDTDIGGPLYAVADGVVFSAGYDPNGSGSKVLAIDYILPDGKKVRSQYLHLSEILVTPGNLVFKDKTVVAKIGNTGLLGTGQTAHLHWDMILDTANYAGGNPNPLTVERALTATSGALFIDDRAMSYPTILNQGTWTIFQVPYHAPSSTAYVEYLGSRYSLSGAVSAGIIYSQVYEYSGSVWTPFPGVAQVFFKPGNSYAVWGFVPNSTLFILSPGNNYQNDRARLDMIRSVKSHPKYNAMTSVRVETYGTDPNWDVSWERHWMSFNFSDGSTVQVEQATNKINRLIRFTHYYDQATNQWTPWVEVGMNVLY